jgi:hypothetical protein
MDPDPDPPIFAIDLQEANKKPFFKFSAYYFLEVTLNHFSKIKSQKEAKNSSNQGFSYYFCFMIEGSGSRRPKNIRNLRILIRIRIRNTASKVQKVQPAFLLKM